MVVLSITGLTKHSTTADFIKDYGKGLAEMYYISGMENLHINLT